MSRTQRLSELEREAYFWTLRRFAATGRPRRAELEQTASTNGLAFEQLLETLAREDLVHLGRDDEIAVAYPFSGRPTPHRRRRRTPAG